MPEVKKINEDSLNEISGGYYNEGATFIQKTCEKDGTGVTPGEKIGEFKLSFSDSKN
jgi:hypothetical protein